MASRKDKIIFLTVGGSVAAVYFWLKYARSGEKTRQFFKEAGDKANRTLGTLQRRTEEIDQFLHETIQTGREERDRIGKVMNDTMKRLEETTDVMQKNLVESSDEIKTMLKEIRSKVEHRSEPNAPESAEIGL